MVKRLLRIVIGLVVILLLITAGSYGYFWYTPRPQLPQTSATVQNGNIQVGTLNRTYLYYIPANLPAHAPLLFVFHGSLQDSAGMRVSTAYEFEMLADTNKFIVVYPDGYMGNWDDCRSQANYPAHTQHIDDEGLVKALIAHFQTTNAIDSTHVFAMGYSNGGQMANRLAVEMPGVIAAVATVASNLPTVDNNDCQLSGKPIPALIMAGTRDPISPFDGGIVSLFGFQPRGSVISSPATVQYFANLAGYTTAPEPTILPHQATSGSTLVSVIDYQAAGKPEVEGYTINGGGHVVPQPTYTFPRLLGSTTHDVDAPAVIWAFFARQSPLVSP
ncbi:MAG: PHB depolymerase family esterase [Chloroflexota bacterium]